METIGDRLRKFGNENFANLTEFAKALAMGQPSLSQYLNNKREPGTPILLRLEHLGCQIDWLLTGEHRIINMVHSYKVKGSLMEGAEAIDSVFFPYHKKHNMYCVYVDGDDNIIDKKKNIYTVLLIDIDREVTNNSEVVVRLKDGKEFYRKVHAPDSEDKFFVPLNNSGNPMIVAHKDIEVLHKVVSRYSKLE